MPVEQRKVANKVREGRGRVREGWGRKGRRGNVGEILEYVLL